MAVYKPSYCAPFSESVDPRVAYIPGVDGNSGQMKDSFYLTCKVNTSNKNVRGFCVRVYDGNDVQVVPPAGFDPVIVPITQLPGWNGNDYVGVNDDTDTNSGLNGTDLKIPFINGSSATKMPGFMYDNTDFLVDYIIFKGAAIANDNSANWTLSGDGKYVTPPNSWDGTLNGEPTMVDDIVAFCNGTALYICYISNDPGSSSPRLIVAKGAYGSSLSAMKDTTVVSLRKGSHAGTVYSITSGVPTEQSAGYLWIDKSGTRHAVSLPYGSQYRWTVALYQGPEPGSDEWSNVVTGNVFNVTRLDYEYFDKLVTTGNVLGSWAERIQLVPKTIKGEEQLPSTITSGVGTPAVLLGSWGQLFDSSSNTEGNPFVLDKNKSSRFYVTAYDQTYGHVYPQTGSLDDGLGGRKRICFWKHSNNESDILSTDMVTCVLDCNSYQKDWASSTSSKTVYFHNVVDPERFSLLDDSAGLALRSSGSSGRDGILGLMIDGYYAENNSLVLVTNAMTGYTVHRCLVGTFSMNATTHYDVIRTDITADGTTTSYYWSYDNYKALVSALGVTLEQSLMLARGKITLADLVLANNLSTNGAVKAADEGVRNYYTKYTTDVPAFSVFATVAEIQPTSSYLSIDSVTAIKGGMSGDPIPTSCPQKNGVYILNLSTNNDGSYSVSLTRGAYNEWSKFIGKLFYVKKGVVYGGTNIESLAQAGGVLYSTNSANSTLAESSGLYFRPEMPYLLYPDFLDGADCDYAYNGSYKTLYNASTKGEDLITEQGAVFTVGTKIFCSEDDKYYTLTGTDNSVTWPTTGTDVGTSAVHVKSGRFMNSIVKSMACQVPVYTEGSDGSISATIGSKNRIVLSPDNYSCEIAYNSTSSTYISPSTSLGIGMALDFPGKTVTSLSPLDRFKINSIDKVAWKIDHETLPEALVSVEDASNGTPYTYDILTCFDVSAENPLNLYEEPYVRFSDTNLATTRYQAFFTLSSVDSDILKRFYANAGDAFYVKVPGSFDLITKRDVTLQTSYLQPQLKSWQSYRWILRDSKDYSIVQDTGNIYNKGMKVRFMGLEQQLPSDSGSSLSHYNENDGKYIASLYVNDTLNNSLQLDTILTCKNEVELKNVGLLSPSFYAEADCVVPAVHIHCSFGSTWPDHVNGVDSAKCYNLYRREYSEFSKTSGSTVNRMERHGNWCLVKYHCTDEDIRDFGVTAGRSYQYCIMWDDAAYQRSFANAVSTETAYSYGMPVTVKWQYWTLTELSETSNTIPYAPILTKTYEVSLGNTWYFKYEADVGGQTHNMNKNEVDTLSRFPKISLGKQNNFSGEISCYLGSEIVSYSKVGYLERSRLSYDHPLSSNAKMDMLEQWRRLVLSRNPKLLKDRKGQAWIVQVLSDTNTPQESYTGLPDKISFSWKQIAAVNDSVSITGPGDELPQDGSSDVWVPLHDFKR